MDGEVPRFCQLQASFREPVKTGTGICTQQPPIKFTMPVRVQGPQEPQEPKEDEITQNIFAVPSQFMEELYIFSCNLRTNN